MKVVKLEHPNQTHSNLIEVTCQNLAGEWRLHSQVYLPGQVLGQGVLLLFFEERPKFKLHEFKPKGVS